jgi:quercetin dioxygenase-like cupin family protein
VTGVASDVGRPSEGAVRRLRAARHPWPVAAAIVFASGVVGPRPVAAQDLVRIAPEFATVEYEDARVRVVRLRIPENGFVAMHDRPRRVVVSLTANDVRLTRADGTQSLTRTEAGTVAWSESTVRTVQNLGGRLENIVIELKDEIDATVPVAAPPASPPPNYLDEPRHRWAFENQYVRVYDVRIPPGETTSFHRHALDQVTVYVSGGRVASQEKGATWGRANDVAAGGVEFTAVARAPFVHRVRNDSAAEYRVIVVQFVRYR